MSATNRPITTRTGTAIATVVTIAGAVLLAACGSSRRTLEPYAVAEVVSDTAAADTTPVSTKPFAFSILEDYDKGADLAEVAKDFALFRELDIGTWRGSFGWDDYEPEPGRYDFAWLLRFVALADSFGITLRPYLGYTPEWVAAGRRADGHVWNDPPRDTTAWVRFVDTLARALRPYDNVPSYEIYNEENARMWWDGTVDEYATVLGAAAATLERADPEAAVLLGGLVWPDADWVEHSCRIALGATASGPEGGVDVVPIHVYAETWPDSVAVEDLLGEDYRRRFLPVVDSACGGAPVWVNETGYATTARRTERDQANWWARAVATFAADPRIVHVGVYEIRDLAPTSDVIGEAENYHLGLTRVDRTKKLAFHTVDLLTDLLETDSLTVLDPRLRVEVVFGRPGRLFHHLFRRPDGRRVLFLWDKQGSPTLRLTLDAPAERIVEYDLDGRKRPGPDVTGRVMAPLRLTPGQVRIFEIR